MSYNISSIAVLRVNEFRLRVDRYQQLKQEMERRMKADPEHPPMPERHIFDDAWLTQCAVKLRDGEGPVLYPRAWWWNGDWSGHCWDVLKEVLGQCEGEAQLLCCWEGGDSYTGLHVQDGVVAEHAVP